jgi:hypothetical protein
MIFSSVCFVFFILKSSSSSGTFQIMNGGDFRDQVRGYLRSQIMTGQQNNASELKVFHGYQLLSVAERGKTLGSR